MRALVITLLLLASAPAAAQEPDAGVTRVRTRVVRPPEGSMRRGSLPVPGWLVYLGGGVVVLGAGAALAWRLGRKKRS